MTKMQKVWLWVSLGMFLVPEILFSFITLSVINIFFGINHNPLIYSFINSQFFTDHQNYLLLALGVELLGSFGLFVLSIKLNKKKIATILGIVTLGLIFILYVGYVVGISMGW